jgi:recombination protein RecT
MTNEQATQTTATAPNDNVKKQEKSAPKTSAKAQEKIVGKQLQKYTDIEKAIAERQGTFAAALPPHIRKDRFMAAALTAVRQDPELLACTPRSLVGALIKAAQDGLLPDGREGVITRYKDEASWNPMVFGMRKRAKELDGIIVKAEVVYENDTEGHGIIQTSGDEDGIVHRPTPLGHARGEMIGAYAIFRDKDREIVHREVMDKNDIEKVKAQSKAPNSLMWKTFTPEAWKKTVVRRGFKSVPCSEKLEAIVRRNDDDFAFDERAPSIERNEQRRDVKSVLDTLASGGGKVIDHEPEQEQPQEQREDQTQEQQSESVVYSPEQSAEHLGVVMDKLNEPLNREELAEIVAFTTPFVKRMTPSDQKKAEATLTKRAMEIIGDGDDLPTFAS